MRSYYKVYQKGSVFYAELGEVPGAPDAIWASLKPEKAEWVNMLNYNYNTYVGLSYFGNDPNLGIPLGSISIGSFLFFEDYSLHPLN